MQFILTYTDADKRTRKRIHKTRRYTQVSHFEKQYPHCPRIDGQTLKTVVHLYFGLLTAQE